MLITIETKQINFLKSVKCFNSVVSLLFLGKQQKNLLLMEW